MAAASASLHPSPRKTPPGSSIAANTAAQGAHASSTFSTGSRFHRRYTTTAATVSAIPPYVNEGSASIATGSRRNACTIPCHQQHPRAHKRRHHRKQTRIPKLLRRQPHPAPSSGSATAQQSTQRRKTPYTDKRNGPTRNTPGTKIIAV